MFKLPPTDFLSKVVFEIASYENCFAFSRSCEHLVQPQIPFGHRAPVGDLVNTTSDLREELGSQSW